MLWIALLLFISIGLFWINAAFGVIACAASAAWFAYAFASDMKKMFF